MVAATYPAAMIRVFADEGRYTDHPADPGGATNWGITIIDARKHWKPDATKEDVRNMPKSVASDIYRKHYANPMRYDDLPAGFDYSVLDAAINSGVGRAPVWAGKALGISAKSINDVVAPANSAPDKVAVIQKYWAVRLAFLHGLRTWGTFGKGWGRRCAQGEAAAVRMWLSVGLNLSAPDAKTKMTIESKKAAGKAKNAGTGAATAGTTTTVGAPALDPSHMSLGGKIALAFAVAAMVALIVYLVRKTIIHNQRAEAYAAT